MEAFSYVDIFATKGIEYIIVICFLLALLAFWRAMTATAREAVASQQRFPLTASATHWFSLADGLHYHQGHAWVKPENESTVKVGMDDFAQKLLGKPRSLKLPRVGERLVQGEKGWGLDIDSKSIEILSPLSGEVVAVNEEVLRAPELAERDPYGRGWLLALRPARLAAEIKNLLSGPLAAAWMEENTERLRSYLGGPVGIALQDGGVPVSGIARALAPEGWEEIARRFLLTED